MAGFGGAAPKGKGKAGKRAKPAAAAALKPKAQWDNFRELVRKSEPTAVFATLPGSDKWYEVGEVVAAGGASAAQAAQLHKRLILEHAVRVYPSLTPSARELQLGVAESAGAEPTAPLAKCDVPDGLKERAGFAGKPDPASGYYVTYAAASDAFTGSSKKLGMGGF